MTNGKHCRSDVTLILLGHLIVRASQDFAVLAVENQVPFGLLSQTASDVLFCCTCEGEQSDVMQKQTKTCPQTNKMLTFDRPDYFQGLKKATHFDFHWMLG